MPQKMSGQDTSETGLIAARDEAAKVEAEAELTLTSVRISGTAKGYGIATMAAIAARERSWEAQKALERYRAGK